LNNSLSERYSIFTTWVKPYTCSFAHQESANISTSSHSSQPPVIKPLNFAPVDAEVIREQVGSESVNIDESSAPQPKSPTKSSEPSVLENLVNHYSGELPGVESNLEKASEVASSEVALESPQQQAPNIQMASAIFSDIPVP